MLFALLAVTLAVAEPKQEQSLDQARAVIVRGTAVLDGAIAEMLTAIDEGIFEDPGGPRTGMVLYAPPEPEPDGLHAVWVVAVFTDSPADRAGVKPGDRIISIDARRLEHESTEVVTGILELKPGAVKLSLLRDKESLNVTVVRETLVCLKAVLDVIGTSTWKARFISLRTLTEILRDKAQDQSLGTPELVTLNRELQTRFSQFQALSEALDYAVNIALRSTCRAKTE